MRIRAIGRDRDTFKIKPLRIRFDTPFWFLLPYFLLFTVFFLVPAITVIPMSFTNWRIVGTPEWIGLGNFAALIKDQFVWKALGNTFYYTVGVTLVLTILGLLLAVLVNQKLRGRVFARMVVVIPYVISSAAAGVLWKWMYDRNFGILNTYITSFGGDPVGWLTDPNVAMISIILMNAWWSVGFNTIIFLAALQGIPEELYQAASVDGATRLQSLRYITVPMLRPIILYVVVLCAANSFQMFDEAYIMTQGGPIGATTTLVYKIYTSAFDSFRFGYASALSLVTLAIILLITFVQFRVAGKRVD
ncbi:MAG: sugar ABC transporter permease [Chloroflexi bacterium]|nr:sugar ABC transporter permease [Chloroflexota bacterium]